MAIIGGAVFTNLMGLVSDKTGHIRFAMVVPLVCFVVIAVFASRSRQAPQPESNAAAFT
jgi:FHS family L-fucose permease-like MFS transporter